MSSLVRRDDESDSLESAMRLADKLIHARSMIPAHIQHPGEVLGIILTGRELGMAPMMALRSISFVGGKPVMDAAAQLGLMRGRGAKHRWLTASDDAERASIELTREGDEPYVSTFTMEMARRMGLASKPNWQKMPAQMLRARAITAGLRAWMPEAMAGVFDPEELEPHHREERREPLHVESRPALTAGRAIPGGGFEVERTDMPALTAGRAIPGGGFEVERTDMPRAATGNTIPASPPPPAARVEGRNEPRTITDVLREINECAHLDKLDALLSEARGLYKTLPPALQHEVTVVCKAAPAAVAERDALRREDERAERELQARADAALAYPAAAQAAAAQAAGEEEDEYRGGGPLDNGDNRGGQTGRVEDGYEPGANDEPDPADLEDAQAERLKRDEVGAPDPIEGVF